MSSAIAELETLCSQAERIAKSACNAHDGELWLVRADAYRRALVAVRASNQRGLEPQGENMEAVNQEAAQTKLLEIYAEHALSIVEHVMDSSVRLTGKETELRALIAKFADMPVATDREEWKRDTLKVWRQMADLISLAVRTLDGRATDNNSQVHTTADSANIVKTAQ